MDTTTPDPDPLMAIGAFSRASLLSVRTLRRHHERGLLVPAEVDPRTGYRSYRVSQLADAQVIRRLRALDVPLTDVAEVLAARDPAITAKVLAAHVAAMQAELERVRDVVDRLQEAATMPSLQTPVHVRQEPATDVLAVRGDVHRHAYATFLGDAYGRLWAAVGHTGAVLAGPSGAQYPASVDDAEVVTAFLPIAAPVEVPDDVLADGVVLDRLPTVTVAVLTHLGGYDDIGETYAQLGAWVARHATTADRPVREHYIVAIDEHGRLLPDDELRTEILWPLDDGHRTTPPHAHLDGTGATP